MFFILLVLSISVVSQFFKHFTKVEKVTIRWRWIALSGLRTTGPRTMDSMYEDYYRVAVRVYVWTKNTLMFQANALEDVEKVRSTNYGMSVLEIHYYIIPY